MISAATVTAVRERAEILDLIEEIATVHKRGDSYVALCPFHSERTPSFKISRQRGGYFYCFGCRASGDSIAFVMRNEGLGFKEAVRSLAERYGINIDEGTAQDRAEEEQRRRAEEELFLINGIAAQFYWDRLWGAESARGATYAFEELESRGLTARPEDASVEGAALAAFKIGYAPAAWRGLVEHLHKAKVSLPSAERAGLLVQKSGRFYDRFRHRLMFPVLDHLGRVVGFSGRILPEPDPRYRDASDFTVGERAGKYVNTPETPIYVKGRALFGLWQGRDAIRREGEAVLVEGNFDVVSLHARGLLNVIAPLGTAFTEEQAKLLRRFTSSAVVAFDGDKAGQKATFDARVHVRSARLTARAAVLPTGEDPDAFVRKQGVDAMRGLVKHARSLREHLLRECFAEAPKDNDARASQINRAIALLGEETDATTRGLEKVFVDQLAARMVVDGHAPADLRDLELKVRRARRASPAAEELAPVDDPVAFALLGAVLDMPLVAFEESVADVLAALEGELAVAVAAAQEPFASTLLEKMPERYRRHAEARLAAPLHRTKDAAIGAIRTNGARLIERQQLVAEGELRAQIRAAEEVGDEAEVDRLLAVLTDRARARLTR